MNRTLSFLLIVATLPLTAFAVRPAEPFANPFLAASTTPVTHGRADFTPLGGPRGPGRPLKADEVQWKPVGPVNAWTMIYSGAYPNGKRVIWIGGYDRVAKLDADTLEVLTTYAIGGNTYYGEEEIQRQIAAMDKLDDAQFIDASLKFWFGGPVASATSAYRMLSRGNEFYLPYRGSDGVIALRVYGEADAADPASAIRLRREWKIPATLSKAPLFGVNMTSDGHVVMVTADGTLIALTSDFSAYESIKLPSQREEGGKVDLFSAFVRNGIATDEQGGIYIVTRDHMHRVQWTGSKLSLDEADGAWAAPYPNELGIGSGTSPGLMGWGEQEDHLVLIADGTRGNQALAFWRDRIPNDWKGLPGYDRRVAGAVPIRFGVAANEQVQIENALVIHGYGVFFDNTFPEKRLSKQSTPTRQWLADSFSMHVPGYEARGGALIRWDAQARKLTQAWQTQDNFVSTVCTASGATDTLYCWGARKREWTLEGIDWNTGKSKFHYTLGKSHRFNPLGGFVTVAPNGAVDCGCAAGLGMVRVQPKQ